MLWFVLAHFVGASLRFLIHDRDARFPMAFDTVFAAEDMRVVRTPYRAPTANAYAERRVRSVRGERLGHLLVVSEAHPRGILATYAAHYNGERPHQRSGQQAPIPVSRGAQHGPVRQRDALGGLIHKYDREAAQPCLRCRTGFSHHSGSRRIG